MTARNTRVLVERAHDVKPALEAAAWPNQHGVVRPEIDPDVAVLQIQRRAVFAEPHHDLALAFYLLEAGPNSEAAFQAKVESDAPTA